MRCTMGSGELSRIFLLKVTLHSVSYRKNGGAGCTSCSPNNFVGEQLLPLSPGSRTYASSILPGDTNWDDFSCFGEHKITMLYTTPYTECKREKGASDNSHKHVY